jgi:hypothetical protein
MSRSSWTNLKSVVCLGVLVLTAPCSRTDRAPEPIETVASALGLNSFPVTVRINQVTIGLTFQGDLDEFSLTRFSSEFFQCGPQATLSNLTFCNKGQVYNLPNDLPQSAIKNTTVETVTASVVPGQTTVTVPITISQMPTASFVGGPITIAITINLSTGTFTAAPQGAPLIKTLTNTCVTTTLDWKFCWEVGLPCTGQTSIPCTTQSPVAGCPPVNGHAACNGPLPGTCVPDPGPGGATCGSVSAAWDLTPNQPPGQASLTEDNGLLLNPRWGWQQGSNQPPEFVSVLKTQPTTHQSAFLCDAGALFSLDSSSGHENWFDATYNGPVRWDDHSAPGLDDDYNISIIPPFAVGTSFPAGITGDNDSKMFIQTEFDSDETIDHFDAIDWWHRFHNAVDNSHAAAAAMIDQHQAVITGLVGLDQSHDNRSELHPVHVFAVRQTMTPVATDDAWSVFFRNWGNEGFCGPGQENLSLTTLTLRLPRPTVAQGVPANATFTLGTATHFVGNFSPPATPIPVSTASNGDPLVTVTLPAPSAQKFIVGEVHLVWSPTGPVTAPAPAPMPALQADEDLGPERSWGELVAGMTQTQRGLFDGLFAGLSAAQPPTIVDFPAVKSATTPPPPTTAPTTVAAPQSARTASRTQARVMAACMATSGSVGTFGDLCRRPDLGTGRCLYASSTLFVDDRVTVVNADGSMGAVANSGTGQTNVGADTKIGQITSVGPVLLRSRASTGPVIAGDTVVLQDGVVHGTIQEYQSIALPGAGLAVALPSSQGKPSIGVEPGAPQSAVPGVYTSVSVKSGATLSLAAGTYYFDSMMLEPLSTVSLDSRASGVTIYIRNSLTVRGAIVDRSGAAPNLFIGVLGTAGATISVPFTGRVIAPNGPITLDTVGAPGYTGSFMGKSLTVHQGSKVVCAPF